MHPSVHKHTSTRRGLMLTHHTGRAVPGPLHLREPSPSSGVHSRNSFKSHVGLVGTCFLVLTFRVFWRGSEGVGKETRAVKDMDRQAQWPVWFLKELTASKSPGL